MKEKVTIYKKNKKPDYFLLLITLCLNIIGLLMVYSASNVVALYKYNNASYFFNRQFISTFLSIIVLIIIINMNIDLFYKYTTLIFILGIVTLVIVLIPGVGVVKGGARSWIGFGAFSFQPAELVKLTMVLLVSKYLGDNSKDLIKFKNFLGILILTCLIFGLIMLQPDFGTGLVLLLSIVILLFCTEAPLKYFIFLLVCGLGGLVVLIISAPYRMLRIMAYLDPWRDPLGSGFQAIQALFAIAPSGIFGLGYNQSMQKHFFLPEPQNDFIFAIVCEELGLIGGVILLGLLLTLILRIIRISNHLTNKYYKYLTLGIGITFFVQVFINIGVVTGLLPVTGITLPIISYGGSSLLLSYMMIGIVVNLSQYQED